MRVGAVRIAVAIAVHQASLHVIVDPVAIPVTPEAVRVRVGILQVAHAIAVPVFVAVIVTVEVPVVVKVRVGGIGIAVVGHTIAIRVAARDFGVVIGAVVVGIVPLGRVVRIGVL